jgi:2-iminobutanoate/2-iminopropanoate deaminase
MLKKTGVTMRRLGVTAVICLGSLFTAGLLAQSGRPLIQRMNPAGIAAPNGYAHVVSVRGGRTIYIAGQLARNAQGETVGKGDFAAQTRQVFANLETALKASGATFNDVVKMNTYVRDAGQVQVVRDVRAQYFTKDVPASTLVEVSRLAAPDFLIEIEAIAVVAD